MTLIDERTTDLFDPPPSPHLDDLVAVEVSEPAPSLLRPVGFAEQISMAWAWGLLGTWLLLFSVMVAVEPEPAVELQPSLFYDVIWPLLFLFALLAMSLGLGARRRWGILAAAATSGMLIVASVGCLATGHHEFGSWWLVQMGCAFGATGLSGAAFWATRRSQAR